MKLYDEKIRISANKALTPEGFLICKNASLARIGARDYAAVEVPELKADDGGIVKIFRDKETLLNDSTIASITGKPITLGHPDDDVNSENSNAVSVGTVLRAYAGDDELLADLIIHDQKAIDAINEGVSELSLGFISTTEQIGKGLAKEHDIKCNHVALVKKGRCGAQCSIKDNAPEVKNSNSFLRGVLKMFDKKKDADGTELEQLVKTLAEQINALSEKVAVLEKNAKSENDEKTDDKKADALPDIQKLVADSVALALKAAKAENDASNQIKKDAAIVAPSLDVNSDNLAINALNEFDKTPEGHAMITTLGGLENCKKDAANSLAALAMSKRLNNSTVQAKQDENKTPSYFEKLKGLWN